MTVEELKAAAEKLVGDCGEVVVVLHPSKPLSFHGFMWEPRIL